ncbi:uncharacterized protein LOC142322801 [Lycorma delicatula]|uniref:uncharacterized protein LOC142322801 n=1 Tax=Lycorma delicatula TaxID=130591 RepID=UPI003F5122F6
MARQMLRRIGLLHDQFFTGHGNFNLYLCKIGRRQESTCMYCNQEDDDAEHTFFACHKWALLRSNAGIDNMRPDEITDYMIQRPIQWKKISDYARSVLTQKDIDERLLGY